jgi:hypothetical protein
MTGGGLRYVHATGVVSRTEMEILGHSSYQMVPRYAMPGHGNSSK